MVSGSLGLKTLLCKRPVYCFSFCPIHGTRPPRILKIVVLSYVVLKGKGRYRGTSPQRSLGHLAGVLRVSQKPCQRKHLKFQKFVIGTRRNHDSHRRDLRRFLRPEIGQISRHFGVISLLNYTENMERKETNPLEKIQQNQSGDGAPKLQISVPCRGRTCPEF